MFRALIFSGDRGQVISCVFADDAHDVGPLFDQKARIVRITADHRRGN